MHTGVIKTLAIVLATSLALAAAPSWGRIVSSISPQGRAIQIGERQATAFAQIINGSPRDTAQGCTVTLDHPSVTLRARAIGGRNGRAGNWGDPVDIPPKGTQRFFLSFDSPNPVEEEVEPVFACDGGLVAPTFKGLNTFQMTASHGPIPDIFPSIATWLRDGVARLDSRGFSYLSGGAVNVGAPGPLRVSVEATGSARGAVTARVCQVSSASGCGHSNRFLPEVVIPEGESPNVFILIEAVGDVTLRPATERLVLRYRDVRGRTVGVGSAAITVDLSRRNVPPVVTTFTAVEDEYQPYLVHFEAEVSDPDSDSWHHPSRPLGRRIACFVVNNYGEGSIRRSRTVSRGIQRGCSNLRSFQYNVVLKPGTFAPDSAGRGLVSVERRVPYTVNPRFIVTDGIDTVRVQPRITMSGTGMFPGQDHVVRLLDASNAWHPNYFMAVVGGALEGHRSAVAERAVSMGVPRDRTFWARYGDGAINVFGIGSGYSIQRLPERLNQRRLNTLGASDFLDDGSLKVVSMPFFGTSPIVEQNVRAVESLDIVWVHSIGNNGVAPGYPDGNYWHQDQFSPERAALLVSNFDRLDGKVIFATAVEIQENGSLELAALDCGLTMDWCFSVPSGTTSSASGILAGMVFIFRQFYQDPQDAVAAMRQCVRDLGEPGTDVRFGVGILDLYACPQSVRDRLGIGRVPTRTPPS